MKHFEICYHESNTAGAMPYLHTHDVYEIYYLHEGNRSYIIDNRVYDIHAGCVALVPPNVFHKTLGGDYERTLVSFSYTFMEKCFNRKMIKNLLACFAEPIYYPDADECVQLTAILEKLNNYEEFSEYDEKPILLAELLTILNKHSRSDKEYEPELASGGLLANILSYISENYEVINSLDEIAAAFGITKYYLCRIFKSSTGMPVFQYINTLKIQKACGMLFNTEKSITDISFECGFTSQMYFCRVFKQHLGMTPSRYRKEARESNVRFMKI